MTNPTPIKPIRKRNTDFTMGMDAEFAGFINNRTVRASTASLHLTGDKKDELVALGGGRYGVDDYVHPFSEELGADGCGVTFELRSAPSKNPLEIVADIYDIFQRNVSRNPKLKNVEFTAGSRYKLQALGGHIHFGVHKGKKEIVKILDNYLFPLCLSLEKRKDALWRRRSGSDYGFMGGYRDQSYGFEYRPLSSWLTSPYVAAGVLSIAKVIVFEYINNPTFDWKYRMNDGGMYQEYVDAGWSQHDAPFHGHIYDKIKAFDKTPIFDDIKKMSMYSVFKPYIDVIEFLNKNNLTWFPKCSMKEAWGIVNVKKLKSKQITLEQIWKD